jgi:hypothetical protein
VPHIIPLKGNRYIPNLYTCIGENGIVFVTTSKNNSILISSYQMKKTLSITKKILPLLIGVIATYILFSCSKDDPQPNVTGTWFLTKREIFENGKLIQSKIAEGCEKKTNVTFDDVNVVVRERWLTCEDAVRSEGTYDPKTKTAQLTSIGEYNFTSVYELKFKNNEMSMTLSEEESQGDTDIQIWYFTKDVQEAD